MQAKQRTELQDINTRIFQLESRLTMDWYSKEQLLEDLYRLRKTIHMLSRKHEDINNHLSDYYNKIDLLVDQLI